MGMVAVQGARDVRANDMRRARVRNAVVIGVLLLGLGEMESLRAAEAERAIGVAPLASPARVPIAGDYWALLIGIDEYAGPRIANLESPVKDVTAVRTVLETRYGFAPARITTLLNEQATRAAIIDTLHGLQKAMGEDDSLFIYYAGHGQYDEDTGQGWWVPADASDPTRPSSFISNEDVQAYIRGMQARHVYLVADSCFSGSLFGTRALPPISDRWYAELYQDRSRWGLTSGATEPVADRGLGGHSPFAYFFLKKLREHGGPYLVPSEIMGEVGPLVTNATAQQPLSEPLKQSGDEGGQFVFRVMKATLPTVVPAPTPEGAQLMLQAQQLAMEQAFWDSVRASDNLADIEEYLKQYPEGMFAGLAKSRLKAAQQRQKAEEARQQREERERPKAKQIKPLPPSLQAFDRQMVTVTGGTFTMGCTREQEGECDDDEKPAHQVRVADFQISRYEVTQALWEAVMGENPSYFENCSQCPVEKVSWNDVQEFLEKLNAMTGDHYRLPSEAEWEYAARGGQRSRGYKYAGSNEADAMAWYRENSGDRTHPVGQKEANEVGVYDMSGNVWEWVADCWNASYAGAPTDGLTWESGECGRRVVRGGSWYVNPGFLRSSNRDWLDSGVRDVYSGFRIARTLSKTAALREEEKAAEVRQRQEERDRPKAKPIEQLPPELQTLDRQMVTVTGGLLMIGCTREQEGECDDNENPAHLVRVADFQISRYEVTRGEWAAFVRATGYSSGNSCWTYENGTVEERSGRSWRNPGFHQTGQGPVVCVSWDDAQAYVRWLREKTGQDYRLPSEAEWEYAARGGQGSQGYKYAGSDEAGSVAWYGKNSGGRTHPVGQKRANEVGLYDMSGNVWEWVADCWNTSYAGAPTDGRAWESGACGRRMLRGGSWYSIVPGYLRSALRLRRVTGFRDGDLGFRIARTLTP